MKNEETKITVKSSFGEKAAYTASGAIISTVSSAAGKIVGNVLSDEVKAKMEEYEIIGEKNINTTDAAKAKVQETLLNDNGEVVDIDDDVVVDGPGSIHPAVPVAIVDDDMSFSEAFAAAREQVGPGGVFEWHNHAFHTYYANEWNDMSASERAEFQASIDYNEVLSDEVTAQHYTDVAQQNLNHINDGDGGDVIDEEDIEVRLVDIGSTDINEDGIRENACILDISGNEVIIVDVDNDGYADIAIHDANDNGYIDEGETLNISEEGMEMPDESDLPTDNLAATDNDLPDYMNDANVDLFNA